MMQFDICVYFVKGGRIHLINKYEDILQVNVNFGRRIDGSMSQEKAQQKLSGIYDTGTRSVQNLTLVVALFQFWNCSVVSRYVFAVILVRHTFSPPERMYQRYEAMRGLWTSAFVYGGVFSWNASICILYSVLISILCFLADICVYNFCDFICFSSFIYDMYRG